MLDQIIPFRYLDRSRREALEEHLVEEVFEAGEYLVRQGDTDDERVFVLVEGAVETVRRRPGDRRRRLDVITAGHYFGEHAALFGEPRAFDARAAERARVHTLPGARFLELIHDSTAFAQALGKVLRDRQGLFRPFDRFRAELLKQVGDGRIDLERLLPFYRELDPALHRHAGDPDTVDAGALAYAVRRLPANLTRTLVYYVTDAVPLLYADPDGRFRAVPTDARRRSVWEMLPGKNMVLVRDGLSDLADLVTCLCVFATEARKIRRRVRDRGGLDTIGEEDTAPLVGLWPDEAGERVREIALHHEDFRIEIHREPQEHRIAHAETWCQQIARATHELLGHDPADLPSGTAVHVVSSNTHSVTNCLSAWLAGRREDILHWAGETGHPLVNEPWQDPYDLVCVLGRDYLKAHPKARRERAEVERETGILALDWTAFTGIAVQLIDTERLPSGAVDPALPDPAAAGRSLIVNIDYAFGEQAEHLMANLLALFGRNLASVSVLGKAGGLVGARGDVLVATGFVEQSREEFYPLPHAPDVASDRLAAMLPDRGVHRGHMLTVTGTLLQNRRMLHFNRHIWGCVGLEMEGSFYLRQILESIHRGALRPDLGLRFLYYVSDLPLEHEANLSARLQAVEGVPPLYAVTREVLTGILTPSDRGRDSA
jgi:CRP-like cAMP-binding protein